MDDRDGRRWAYSTFGDVGPQLRDLVPQLVARAHLAMTRAQKLSGLHGQHVYGLVWRRTLQEFEEGLLDQVAGARALVIPRAGYRVVAVNGVALFPWRYAKDVATDPWRATMGPPSPTRRAILRGVRPDTGQLEFDLQLPQPSDTDEPDRPEGADDINGPGRPGGADDINGADASPVADEHDERSVLVELARRTREVVVVRYASVAGALLAVYWGDGQLQDDGTIVGAFGERLTAPWGAGLRAG